MTAIRLHTKLCLAGFTLLAFVQCSSRKTVKNPPFVLGEVRIEEWSAGTGENSGTHLFIPVEAGKDIPLDSVYFRGEAVKLEKIQRDSYLVYRGRFKKPAQQEKDRIAHADPKAELGNKPPQLKRKIPFSLKDHEAVIRFKEKGKTKYFKIENIKTSVPVHVRKNQPKKSATIR
jgi:hypothetical protein